MDKEQIKARFFGAHIGCSCVAYAEPNEVSVGNFEYILTDEDSKLILRPLSSITYEEAIECAGIACENIFKNARRYDGWITVENGNSPRVYIGLYFKNSGVWGEDGDSLKNDIAAVGYLCSKNFYLPFMGYDPIKEGWAILSEQ